MFFIIYHCYTYVVPDLIYLKQLILRKPHQSLKTLNIGAGLAFHDIFLSQMTKKIKSFNIIGKSSLNYADEIYPIIKEDNILNVYELRKQSILDNNGVLLIDVRDSFQNHELMKSFKSHLILAEDGKHKRYIFIK